MPLLSFKLKAECKWIYCKTCHVWWRWSFLLINDATSKGFSLLIKLWICPVLGENISCHLKVCFCGHLVIALKLFCYLSGCTFSDEINDVAHPPWVNRVIWESKVTGCVFFQNTLHLGFAQNRDYNVCYCVHAYTLVWDDEDQSYNA